MGDEPQVTPATQTKENADQTRGEPSTLCVVCSAIPLLALFGSLLHFLFVTPLSNSPWKKLFTVFCNVSQPYLSTCALLNWLHVQYWDQSV